MDKKTKFPCSINQALALPEGTMLKVTVPGREPIAVYRVDGKLYATADLCSHGNASLTDGDLEAGAVICPLHGGSFDVRTGEPIDPPCVTGIQTYTVVETSDAAYVELSISEDESR